MRRLVARPATSRPASSRRVGLGALIAFLALPAAPLAVTPLAAQNAGMETMRGYLLNGFERAKAWDVSLAQAMPDSAMSWAPSEGVRGFAAQIVHTANNTFIGGPLFGMDAPAFGVTEQAPGDKAALIAAVQAGYDWIIEHLRSMSAADLAADATLFGQTVPRWRIGMFALEHAMWTRGQLVPYLHAHGVEVPQQRLF